MPMIPKKKMRIGRMWNRPPVQLKLLGAMGGERPMPPMDLPVSTRENVARKRRKRRSVYEIDLAGRKPTRFGRTKTREGIV